MKKIIIGATALLVTASVAGCASSETSAETPESSTFTPPPYSYTPEPEPVVEEEPQLSENSTRLLYLSHLEANEVQYASADSVVNTGKIACTGYDMNGYKSTTDDLLESNRNANRPFEPRDLAAIAWGAATYLCPEHEDAFKSWAQSM